MKKRIPLVWQLYGIGLVLSSHQFLFSLAHHRGPLLFPCFLLFAFPYVAEKENKPHTNGLTTKVRKALNQCLLHYAHSIFRGYSEGFSSNYV